MQEILDGLAQSDRERILRDLVAQLPKWDQRDDRWEAAIELRQLILARVEYCNDMKEGNDQ